MTHDDRELAEKLCLSLPDCLGGSHDTVETLMRLYPEQFQIFVFEVRTLITAELAAKAVPNGFRIILKKPETTDGWYSFVEVEDGDGRSFHAGPWIERGDVYCEVNADNILATLTAQAEALRKENERLREALTPSGDTKAAYSGEFKMPITLCAYNEEGEFFEETQRHIIPWTSIKEIMAAIKARAALEASNAKEGE